MWIQIRQGFQAETMAYLYSWHFSNTNDTTKEEKWSHQETDITPRLYHAAETKESGAIIYSTGHGTKSKKSTTVKIQTWRGQFEVESFEFWKTEVFLFLEKQQRHKTMMSQLS